MDNDFQNYISDMSKSVNLDQSVIVQSSQIANLNLAQYSNIMSKMDPNSGKGTFRNQTLNVTHQNSYHLDHSFAKATYNGSSQNRGTPSGFDLNSYQKVTSIEHLTMSLDPQETKNLLQIKNLNPFINLK